MPKIKNIEMIYLQNSCWLISQFDDAFEMLVLILFKEGKCTKQVDNKMFKFRINCFSIFV